MTRHRSPRWTPTIVSLQFIGTVVKRGDNLYLAARFNFEDCDEYDCFRGVKTGMEWIAEGREGVVRERSEVNRDVWFVYAKREDV